MGVSQGSGSDHAVKVEVTSALMCREEIGMKGKECPRPGSFHSLVLFNL